METADNLKGIIARQREVLSELEAQQRVLAGSDLVKENAALKTDIEKLRADYEQARSRAALLTDENAGLKNALYEQVYNEKVKIINTTAQKLEIYFRAQIGGELNTLTALENRVKARIHGMRETLARNNVDAKEEIYAQLDELSHLTDRKVTEARAEAIKTPDALSPLELYELEALTNEQVTDEQILTVAKKNNLERFVGLNVLNAVGIFLLIIGAITLARFSYTQISDLLKGIMLFAFGGAMLAAGEFLNRKKPNIFSLGISAGGIGILYAALATSYFGLHILEMYPAIAVCVLITAGAFVLSDRYNSQTIAAFALIGGYLPMFSIGPATTVIFGAMLYFIMLNLLALLISLRRKWRIASFIGLILNIIGTVYICSNFYGANRALERIIAIVYVLFAFLIYTSIPIVSTYRAKAKFKKSDIVLLAINTFFSSLIIYSLFYSFNLRDFDGLLAAAFAGIYLFLGKFIEKKFAGDERHVKALFYLTGLAFVVLIIPLQFGMAWLSLGWLAEGVLLSVYGIIKNEKSLKKAGFVVCALCVGAFLIIDSTWWRGDQLFVYKYLAVTLGSLAILGAYMHIKMTSGLFVKIYKYFAFINLWWFSAYLINDKLGDVLLLRSGLAFHQADYLVIAAGVTVTFLLAYVFSRIRLLSDTGIKIFSIVLYVVGIFELFRANATLSPFPGAYMRTGAPSLGITIVGTAILVVLGLLSVFALRDLMKIIVAHRKIGIEWYPLVISGYFVLILTQNLIAQFNLSFSSAAISIIYALTALAWIIFGFARRYSFIRKFGLILALLAVAKLFLIDLSGLTQGFRIISYFILGIALLAISFVYQYFNKRLELKEGTSFDEGNNM